MAFLDKKTGVKFCEKNEGKACKSSVEGGLKLCDSSFFKIFCMKILDKGGRGSKNLAFCVTSSMNGS